MRQIIEWIWSAPMWQVIIFLPFLLVWFGIAFGLLIELIRLAFKGDLW